MSVDTFDVRDILYPTASAGRGKAQGVEFLVEKKFTDKWFGQMNLAWQRTRHAGLDGIRRPSAFDYPVIFNLVGGRRLSRKWGSRDSIRVPRRATVHPRSIRSFLPSSVGASSTSIASTANAPPISTASTSASDRTFTVNDKPLIVFLGFQNITNRNNFNGIDWSRRLNRQTFEDGNGLFPLFGLDWTF